MLAHELTHALEDQRFGARPPSAARPTTTARWRGWRCVEGTATAVMDTLRRAHFISRGGARRRCSARRFAATPATCRRSSRRRPVFPYVGRRGVRRRICATGPAGAGRSSNTAVRGCPAGLDRAGPAPGRVPRADEPKPVRDAAACSGWTRAAAGTWGELQTRELLAHGGGGRTRPPRAGAATATSCGGPARRERAGHALALGHAARRARVRTALREWAQGLHKPHAVVDRGGAVTLVVADDKRVVRRVAAGS